MSRCFPYSEYASKIAGDAALIESIKLQRGMEKTKEEIKKEKKEKKRQRRERRERRKNITSETKHDGETQFNNEEIHKGKKRVVGLNGEYLEKKTEDEVDEQQKERSNLTQEHGQAVNLHAPCNSADSTENSNKRRRTSSSSTANIAPSTANIAPSTANVAPSTANNRPGNVIRIKLKHNGSVASISRELPNSSSERTQLSSHMHDKELANSSGDRTLTQHKLGALNVETTNSVTPRSVLGEAQNLAHSLCLPSIPQEVKKDLPRSRNPPSVSGEAQKSSARLSNLPAIPEVAQQQLTRLSNLPTIIREAQNSTARLSNLPAIPGEAQKNNPSVSGEAQKSLFCSPHLPIEESQKKLSNPGKSRKSLAPSIPVESEKQRQYNQLFNFCGPLLALVEESDNDDWLFTKKQKQCRPKEERFDGHGRSLTSCSLGYQCAQYLPDAGVYALPYTMPL